MRILVDTNILINLEDNKVLDETFTKLYNLAIEGGCKIVYNSACIEDINRDKDEERKSIIKSKLKKYSIQENPAKITSEFTSLVGEKKENDKIDNTQLFQLYKGYVELFVTNDNGIKKKSVKLGISDRVLTSEEAFSFLDDKFTLTIPAHPVLEHVSVRDLEEDFESEFFLSLKNDYDPEIFLKWIEKCAQQDRKCYRLKIEDNLSALLIYNQESRDNHSLKGINEEAIKICTLKVGEGALGMKLGELFLNKMFQLGYSLGINYLYVTTYEKQEALIYILEKFGFSRHQEFKNNVGQTEFVYLKSLKATEQVGKEGNQLHPFFSDKVNKFVIPIQPKFYSSLFKDGNLRTPTLFDDQDYGLDEVQGNTIIKAYISNSTRTDLEPGDLLFFYSSKNYKSIEPIGVLIEHKRVNNLEELWNLVKSKTVYSRQFLKSWLESDDRKYVTVTIFRLAQYLKPPFKFEDIKNLNSYGNKFQTITKLSEDDYQKIKNECIDESFIID